MASRSRACRSRHRLADCRDGATEHPFARTRRRRWCLANSRRRHGGSPAQNPDLLVRRHDAARRPAVRRGCRGAESSTARQLCRAELDKFRAAAAGGEPLIVGCTQEAPLFSEAAEAADISYVNIRETAGWSADAACGGSQDGGADCGRGRTRARNSVRHAHQRRRHPDLRPRRAGDRGRQPAQGPSRRHRADQAARGA